MERCLLSSLVRNVFNWYIGTPSRVHPVGLTLTHIPHLAEARKAHIFLHWRGTTGWFPYKATHVEKTWHY